METIMEKTVKNKYYPIPSDGRKSFYEKAKVKLYTDGTSILYSYDTKIIYKDENGQYWRLWDGWSATTGRHIKSFCGMNKKQYESLPLRYFKLYELEDK